MSDTPASKDFNPGFSHPYYFIRKGLHNGIQKYAGQLQGKLLDFGCGKKPYQHLFKVQEYIGVDFNNEGHPHENEAIDVFYDGKTIPFEAARFDCILCSEVFEHLFNLPELLPQLNKVLKPGGKMLITCPFVWPLHEKPYDYARYTPYALQHELEKNGFEILIAEKNGNFFTAVHQLRMAYLHDVLLPKLTLKPLIYLARRTIVPLANIAGFLLNKILPNNQNLYLNNIIVAQKK